MQHITVVKEEIHLNAAFQNFYTIKWFAIQTEKKHNGVYVSHGQAKILMFVFIHQWS